MSKKKPIVIDWKELFEAYAKLVIEANEELDDLRRKWKKKS